MTLYASFGALMGYAFWVFVSAVNQPLVPASLLAVGAAWLLQQPVRPAALFTGIVALLCLGMVGLQYQDRYDLVDAETVRRAALTSLVVLGVGLVDLVLGVAEATLPGRRKAKRSARSPARRLG